MSNIKELNTASVLAIKAAFELARRRVVQKTNQIESITSSDCVYQLMHPILGALPHEEC